MPLYLRPEQVAEALAALAWQPFEILAGGTDFYPGRVGRLVDEDILDITRIGALRGIVDEPKHYRFGSTVTWGEVFRAELPGWLGGLQRAAREVGGAQIQNAGTIGGNLCNASAAADGVPVLMALNASVELTSHAGRRLVPLTEFLVGNRKTQLTRGELLTAVLVPKPEGATRSVFVKLGSRRYLVISIVMIAVSLTVDGDDRVMQAGVAVGACSAVAQRLRELEKVLIGVPADAAWHMVRAEHLECLSPIDDVRGDAGYRWRVALGMVRDALKEVGAKAGRGPGALGELRE